MSDSLIGARCGRQRYTALRSSLRPANAPDSRGHFQLRVSAMPRSSRCRLPPMRYAVRRRTSPILRAWFVHISAASGSSRIDTGRGREFVCRPVVGHHPFRLPYVTGSIKDSASTFVCQNTVCSLQVVDCRYWRFDSTADRDRPGLMQCGVVFWPSRPKRRPSMAPVPTRWCRRSRVILGLVKPTRWQQEAIRVA